AKAQADRDVDLINKDLGVAAMNAAQTEQLHRLIRDEVYNYHSDDTDVFRSPENMDQFYNAAVERVARQAAGFLSAEQIDAFRKLAASDLVGTQQQLGEKRKGYGL